MSKSLQIKNPYTDELLAELPYASSEKRAQIIASAYASFQKWKHALSWQRSELLLSVASELEAQKDSFAQLITQEAGKPVAYAQAEVQRALGVLRWAAAESVRFSGELLKLDTAPWGRPGFGLHTRVPRGVILGITPFNFPLNLMVHKVAPAVACGCSVVIKPSPFTPLTAMKFASLFQNHVKDLVQVVIADDVGSAELTAHPQVAMVSFTGSTEVGWKIRRQAPEKPTALELGGNAWLMVMEDTPEELYPLIAKKVAQAAFGYAGQSCISVQNVAIEESIGQAFLPHLKAATESTRFGDPQASGVVCGPMIHANARERVSSWVHQVQSHAQQLGEVETIVSLSLQASSAQVGQGVLPPSLVVFHPKTEAQSLCVSQSALVQQEIFGPVMTARVFDELSQVVSWVNSSRYGLQSGVFTQNWKTVETLHRELDVGGLVMNDVPTTRYDHQPYGGVKESGQGREGVRYAMEEMTESKFLALSSVIA